MECGIGQLVAELFGGAMVPWEISNDTNPRPLNQALILLFIQDKLVHL